VCPALVLLLLCDPFRQQVGQGQLNLFLLLLTTGVWVAERSGRPWLAGILLGVAAVVKLVPAFLFLYFALRRQGRVLLAGMATVTVLTLLTLALLGFDTYQSYINDVVPEVAAARSDWQNNSLQGIWAKLFDPAAHSAHLLPLWSNPLLARLGAAISCLAVVVLLAWVTWKARTRRECDQAYGLGLIAMLLVQPTTWNHIFLLLLLPLALLWLHLPTTATARVAFLVLLAALFLEPVHMFNYLVPGGFPNGLASPWHTLLILSFQCYALLGLFLFSLQRQRQSAS
jgi:uncharacterized membrane protein